MKDLNSKFKSRSNQKGQTLLEYAFLLMVVFFPLAAAMKTALQDQTDKGEKKKNLIYRFVKDSYGDNGEMGVIGRPYP